MAKAIITTDPYTEVNIEPMSVAGVQVPKMGVMVRDDQGDWRLGGTVSTGYKLIKNEKANNVLSDIMTRSEKEWKPFRQLWDGHRFMTAHMTANPIFQVGGKLQRDVHMGIMMQNSYDGSCALHLEMFLAFQQCLNQCVDRNRFGSFIIRHTSRDDETLDFDIDDAVTQISAGAQNLLEVAPVYEKMASTKLTIPKLKAARRAKLVPNSYWGHVIDALEDDSQWGLYNALTNVATHKVSGFASINSGQNIGKHFLN